MTKTELLQKLAALEKEQFELEMIDMQNTRQRARSWELIREIADVKKEINAAA